MKCKACKRLAEPTDIKVCSLCSEQYHYQCLSITTENFHKESKQTKANWKCPACKSSERKRDNTNTPIRQQNPSASSSALSGTSDSSVDDLKLYFESKLQEATATILSQVRQQIVSENKALHQELEKLKESICYVTTQFEDLSKQVTEKTKIIETLKAENEELRSQAAEVNRQLNHIEQQSRSCNIELQCVPENKAENLLTTIKQLGKVIARDINDNEIVDFHRVQKINQQSNRPRSIVVKLTNPRVRDDIIVAVRKFNRVNSQEKLHSGHLGIAGNRQPVFVSEHLSPANKKLHAATRIIVKEKQYQFLWVRNGKIFVRKNETSKSILISSEEILKTL